MLRLLAILPTALFICWMDASVGAEPSKENPTISLSLEAVTKTVR